MIGRLAGVLREKQPPQVLLEVQGVSYEIDVPMSTFYDLPESGASVMLYTHLVIREDMHLLFGFLTESERQTFRALIKISGIGARMALALLSGLSVSELYQAVASRDSVRLTMVPGIGKKTAERLILELRDKLSPIVRDLDHVSSSCSYSNDIKNALISLGYSEREVAWAIKSVDNHESLSDGIRQALQLLSKEK